MKLIAELLLAVAALSLNATIAAPSLHAADERVLSVRNAHSMIFDTDRKTIYLFGGADASSVRGDTWRWDNEKKIWRFVTASGPSPRTLAAFAYDERSHQGILFGGNRVPFGNGTENDSFLADTWIFRNNNWTRVATSGPEERAEAAIAYDRKRGRIVLFGGYRRRSGSTERFGDTWEWDGRNWMRVAKGVRHPGTMLQCHMTSVGMKLFFLAGRGPRTRPGYGTAILGID